MRAIHRPEILRLNVRVGLRKYWGVGLGGGRGITVGQYVTYFAKFGKTLFRLEGPSQKYV